MMTVAGGTLDGVRLGGPRDGAARLTRDAACAKVADLPEVRSLARGAARPLVTALDDPTDNVFICTGSAGECLHWCRVDRPATGKGIFWRHFGVDPDSGDVFVCARADIAACHEGSFVPRQPP